MSTFDDDDGDPGAGDDGVLYDIVLPFVVCQSQGGPYEDDAYVAGYEIGEISTMLAQNAFLEWERPVHTGNLAQLDLVAMRWSYIVAERVEVDDTWTAVKIVKAPAA